MKLKVFTTLGLTVLATLYTSVYILGLVYPNQDGQAYSVQIVHMLEINGTFTGMIFQIFYTFLLVLTAILSVLNFNKNSRPLNKVITGLSFTIFATTSGSLLYAYLFNWKPGRYEYYVFEALTAIAALTCAYISAKEHNVQRLQVIKPSTDVSII
ncbi:MAG: hypothetical protein NE328_11610 [Lentisphaeraceae bacterium]|nr:hypothetical protein [Lentisphaeraceae bacterium]